MKILIDDYMHSLLQKQSYEIKKVISFNGIDIGQKLVLEADEISYSMAFADEKELMRYTNEFIRLVGYAIDAFDEHISELNDHWDMLHEEEYPMEPGTQLYNDYGHYILDFYSRVCAELNEVQGEAADWIFYGRMIGGEPIWAAMLRADPNITIHLEYYDSAKEQSQ